MPFWILGGFWLILAIFSTIRDRRKFRNSIFFFFALLFFLVGITTLSTSPLLRTVFLLLYSLIPFFIVVLSVFLIYNGFVMIKKEGKKLSNLLSLLVGAGILSLIGANIYFLYIRPNNLIPHIVLYINLLFLYVGLTFASFFLYSFLYGIFPKQKRCDFVLILGAGLLNGNRVSPLLAKRLDKGIELYEKGGKTARLVVSGGQGGNETISEASAMQQYLLENGISADAILLEDKSTTTMENIQYSKALMDSVQEPYTCVFVTNNYHVFRASMYARKAGLKAEGVGCKTAHYFWPSAFIREYIAIMAQFKGIFITYAVFCLLAVAVSLF